MEWDDYLEEIESFADALELCEETERTADSLRRVFSHMRHTWHREQRASSGDVGIEIPPPRLKAMHPRLCKVSSAELRFIFVLGETFEETSMPKQADFQVRVAGYLEAANSVVDLEDHWRVDSHVFPDIEKTREPHPYFHFQRGGHAQDEFERHHRFLPSENLPDNEDASWRGLMHSASPRIAMAPYCPILAIDYAISQHDGDIWRKLRDETTYRSVVHRAQERLWTPFFGALARPEIRKLWMGPVFA
jgi:hypothetical protein